MTRLGQGLALRPCTTPLLVTGTAVLRLADLPPPGRLPPSGAAVTVSMHGVANLLAALVALDGHAARMLLLAGDMPAAEVLRLAEAAGCDVLLSDRADLPGAIRPEAGHGAGPPGVTRATEWILASSGTTGLPKLIRHDLSGLSRSVRPLATGAPRPVWALGYEPTRFAGLQVLLQAVLGGGTLVAAEAGTGLAARLGLFTRAGCTHFSATPTLWRQILMHPAADGLKLRQITLGGEIADQPVLSALATRFPAARITHIYASTEAGVGFSVTDGREGFPAGLLEGGRLRIDEGRLWIRPAGPPPGSLGPMPLPMNEDGFIDTRDRVERRGDRVHFLGREGGGINVGGAKVQPEMVERAILMLPEVALVRVTGKRNPLSGAVIIAEVVPREPPEDQAGFRRLVIQHCRATLPPEAVPALIRLAPELAVNASGKLMRG